MSVHMSARTRPPSVHPRVNESANSRVFPCTRTRVRPYVRAQVCTHVRTSPVRPRLSVHMSVRTCFPPARSHVQILIHYNMNMRIKSSQNLLYLHSSMVHCTLRMCYLSPACMDTKPYIIFYICQLCVDSTGGRATQYFSSALMCLLHLHSFRCHRETRNCGMCM